MTAITFIIFHTTFPFITLTKVLIKCFSMMGDDMYVGMISGCWDVTFTKQYFICSDSVDGNVTILRPFLNKEL